MGTKPFDLIGQKFGKLTVVANAGRTNGGRRVAIRCDCGTEKTLFAAELRRGRTRSCGCMYATHARANFTKHGHSPRAGATPEYRIWHSMVARCTNPNNTTFAKYGGRGIAICDRWRSDFAAFLADMGPRPSPQHSIDRIDGNGNYEPDNCRWATMFVQSRNKRTAAMLTAFGETRHIADWEQPAGMTAGTIRGRLNRGWSPERAVSEPPRRAA